MHIRRRYWLPPVVALIGLVAAILIVLALRIPFSSEKVRQKVIETLSAELDAEVELGEVTIRLLPLVHMRGKGLAIYHQGRRDVPPLIAVEAFTVEAGPLDLWRRHINRVKVEGLSIQVPPEQEQEQPKRPSRGASAAKDFVVDNLIADNSTLSIIPRNPEKAPRVWQMHELRLQQVGIAAKMPFRSVLTNAVPPGRIITSGTFGPWAVEDPGQTPLDGDFTLDDADLGVFKGISGILSARGAYAGVLERIDIAGETDTPAFMVNISGHPVPLRTKYHATVDGTNGDTMLERIDATFLNTSLVAKGGVYNKPGVRGRTVTLDVTMDEARLEDLMRLAVKTTDAPMTGALSLVTKFELPPGDRDVIEKLILDGRFAIGKGRFTNPGVQRQIAELSRRASGKAVPGVRAAPVDSDFTGRFKLANGVLALPSVTFDVPGAAVQLAGHYNLQQEQVAFAGNLFMDAKISETMTGWKSLLLKMVDPIFRKNGRTVIPIKITGTTNAPSFGLDRKRVFNRGDTPSPGTKPAGRRENRKSRCSRALTSGAPPALSFALPSPPLLQRFRAWDPQKAARR